VTLQPAAGDTGKPCGVDYELKTYVAETSEDKSHKRSSVRLAIRKLTYAPETPAPQPVIEAHKDFMMSPAPLHLECTLDKEVKYCLIIHFKFIIKKFRCIIMVKVSM